MSTDRPRPDQSRAPGGTDRGPDTDAPDDEAPDADTGAQDAGSETGPGAGARDRLADRAPGVDRPDLLSRAFPGATSDLGPPPPAEPTSPGYRRLGEALDDAEFAERLVSALNQADPHLRSTELLDLWARAANEGNWNRVGQVIDAAGVEGPGQQDAMRVSTVESAFNHGEPGPARFFADAIADDDVRRSLVARLGIIEGRRG
jgi:hypothetical protein